METTEELLCDGEIKFYGQPVGLIVAEREKIAHKAASLVKIKYSTESKKIPLLNIQDVMTSTEKSKRVRNDSSIDPSDTGNDIKMVVKGSMSMGSQYHYYMEPQTSVARLTEDGMEVFAATQWMDLSSIAIAKLLKIPVNR